MDFGKSEGAEKGGSLMIDQTHLIHSNSIMIDQT